jgi:hypothetical protein
LIQLTVSNTRTVEKKKVLYRKIVENLTADAGLRPEDIFINLVEVLPENWSFGHGIAQYVAEQELTVRCDAPVRRCGCGPLRRPSLPAWWNTPPTSWNSSLTFTPRSTSSARAASM